MKQNLLALSFALAALSACQSTTPVKGTLYTLEGSVTFVNNCTEGLEEGIIASGFEGPIWVQGTLIQNSGNQQVRQNFSVPFPVEYSANKREMTIKHFKVPVDWTHPTSAEEWYISSFSPVQGGGGNPCINCPCPRNYRCTMDPFEQTVKLIQGDTKVFWPNKKGPLQNVRLNCKCAKVFKPSRGDGQRRRPTPQGAGQHQ